MSTPIILEFLAETDDLLAGTSRVESKVASMVQSTASTTRAVEAVVNEIARSMLGVIGTVESTVGQAVGSASVLTGLVEDAVARAIAAASNQAAAAKAVIEQTRAAAASAVTSVDEVATSSIDAVSKAVGGTAEIIRAAKETATAAVSSVDEVVSHSISSASKAVQATGNVVSSFQGVIKETKDTAKTAVSSVDEVVAHATDAVKARFEGLRGTASEIIEDLRATAQAAKTILVPAIGGVTSAYKEIKGQIEGASAAGAAGFAGLGATTLAVGGAALEVGRKYEDLRAQLQGLTGDAEQARTLFDSAASYAAETPFSVDELVAATRTLKGFGQEGRENLELVANIAAATGQSLEDTSLRVGKALAGISEGFQGLRDVSGITAQRLVEYGAVMNSAGGISVQTAEEIAKARQALQELGRQEFAGNVERQSATLTGAMSNAGDAVANFAATLGEKLVPTASLMVRAFSATVGAATSLASTFSFLTPIIGVSALAISGIGVAAFTATGILAGFIARAVLLQTAMAGAGLVLGQFGVSVAGAAAALRAAVLGEIGAEAFGTLSTAVSGAATRFIAFRTAIVTASASALTGITGFVTGAVARLTQLRAFIAASNLAPLFSFGGIAAISVGVVAAKVAFEAMEESARAAGDEVNRTSDEFQRVAHSFRTTSELLKAVAGGPGLTFGADVRKNAQEAEAALAGISDIGVLTGIEAAGSSFEQLNAQLANNRRLSDDVKREMQQVAEALKAAEAEQIRLPNNDDAANQVKTLKDRLVELNVEFKRLGSDSAVLNVFIDRVKDVAPALKEATEAASRLEPFLKFASSLDDVGQLRAAIGELDGVIAETGANVAKVFGTTDRFKLGSMLADEDIAKNKQSVEVIEKYLGLLEKRESFEGKISKLTEDASKTAIRAYEEQTARLKVAGDLTLQQERARIEGELDLVKRGTAEETRLLEQLAAKDREILQKREQLAKSALEKRVGQIEEAMAAATSVPDVSAADTSKALRSGIASLEAFGAAQKSAFANAPEAAEAFRRKLAELNRELAASKGKELEENLSKLKAELDKFDSGATTGEQLEQVAAAIVSLKAAMAAKTVEQSGAEEYLATLEEKKLQLVREQTNEKRKQVDEVSALQMKALEQEIEILEARKAAGENVERELKQKNADRVQAQLDNIDKVLQREIEAGGDVTLAEEKAALARKAIYNKEALDKYQAAQKAVGNIEQLGKRGGKRNGSAVSNFQPSFQPGPSSGSPGAPTLFSGIQPTALPDFAADFGRRIIREAPRAPRFDAVVRQTNQEIQRNQQERARQGGGGSTTTDNRKFETNVTLEGMTVGKFLAGPDFRDAVIKVAQSVARDEAFRS